MAKAKSFQQQPTTAAILTAVVIVCAVALIPSALVSTHMMLQALIAVTAVLFLLWLFLNRLRTCVFSPLGSLASQAKYITIYKDYSLRLYRPQHLDYPQEVSVLYDALNSMLEEIEHRESRLEHKNMELDRARTQAEAANLAKSQFMANISHELRTPLNSIIGFSAMMSSEQFGPLQDKYREYVMDISDSSQRLLEIINDILDLAKAESGHLTVQYDSFQLSKIIDKAINMLRERAVTGKISVDVLTKASGSRIVADRVRILQIVISLLSNAIKFSPPGSSVEINYEIEAVNDDISYVTLEVIDQGIGMTPEEISTALGRFNQLDAGLNRRYEGAGLGLPLTKKLVELHAGNLRIESEKGKGTRVKVKFISNVSLLD